MRNTILTILLLLPSIASSDTGSWLDIPIGSKHAYDTVFVDNKEYELNESNFGLGVAWPVSDEDSPNQGYRVGMFKNSYNETSLYAAMDFYTTNPTWNVGALVGFVSGYDIEPVNSRPLLFGAIPYIDYNIMDDVRVEMSYVHGRYASAIGFTLRLEI